jgi:hypothetical protein
MPIHYFRPRRFRSMEWGSKNRFATVGTACLFAGPVLLLARAYVGANTYSYYLLSLFMMVLGMVFLSLGIVVVVVGSLRAS